MPKLEQIQLAQRELERPMSELMISLDDLEIDLPSFMTLESIDQDSQRELKFQFLWAQSRDRICKSTRIKTLCNDSRIEGRAMLVCAVADYFTVNGAITLGAIIVKEGLHMLCASHWVTSE